MRRLILFLFLPCLCLGNPVDEAKAELKAERDSVAAQNAKFAQERAELGVLIEKSKAEAETLEFELAAQKQSLAEIENASQALSAKNLEFERLRTEAFKHSVFLNKSGFNVSETFSHDPEIFNSEFEALCKDTRAKLNPGGIFESIVPNNPQLAAAGYMEGKTQKLELDLSMGRLSKLRSQTLVERYKAGGIWMYPILAFGFLSLVIATAKIYTSFKARRAPSRLLASITALLHGQKIAEAKALAAKAPYPYRDLLVSLVENRSTEKILLEEMSYEHMLSVGEKLYSGLGFVSVTAAVAPLLGLLGTVTGIIRTFGDLSLYGSGNSQLMSAGISEALITTEFGLIVAIPSLVAHALLSRRAKAILSDMEKLSAGFLSSCSK